MALLLRAVYSVLKQESFVNTLPATAGYLLPHRSMNVQLRLKNVQDYATALYLPKGKVLKQESFVNTLPAPARYPLPHRSMSVQVGLQNVQDSPTVMYLPKEKALQLIPTPMMHSLPDVKVCQYGSKNVLNYTMTRISPLHKQPHPQVFMSFSFSSEIMGSAMVRPCLRFQSKGRHAHMCRNQWIAKRNLSLKRNIKFPWQEATSFGQQQAFLRWKSNMKTMAGTVVKSFILPTKEFLMKCMVFLKNASLAFVRIIRRGFVARLVDICFTYFVLVLVGTVLYVVDVLTGGKLGIFVDTGEEVDLDEYLTPGTSVSKICPVEAGCEVSKRNDEDPQGTG